MTSPDQTTPKDNGEDPSAGWLTPGVAGIGAASFFSDAGHELATSVLPTFLTSTLHAGPGALGAIEGVSDALVGLSKLAGGPLANDPKRRARLATSGYLGTAIATAGIGLCVAVWQVAILRAIAWMSRGIRSPARDTMLASITPRSAYGRANGVERAGDNAGAIVGPLLAAREARRTVTTEVGRRTLTFNLKELRDAGLARALTPAAFFELGNLATTLLILRATNLLNTSSRTLTAATSLAILLYAAHNAFATIASIIGGHLADRFNPRMVFGAGAAVYVISYGTFALNQHAWPILLLAFALAGIGIGCAETAQSTTVALLLPDRLRGNGFGVLGLVQSFGDLGATVVAGMLWTVFSPTIAFSYVAVWMLASVLAVLIVRPPGTITPSDT